MPSRAHPDRLGWPRVLARMLLVVLPAQVVATFFSARFAAANLVPPEEMRSFIEPDTSSTKSTLVDSSPGPTAV